MAAFPQSDSNLPALKGSDFWRLKQELFSPGDIFESEQGAHAFAIGPDSDIANVDIYYFDDQQLVTKLSRLTISPDRQFDGIINARLDTIYPLSERTGRILIAPTELFNPAWRPDGFSGTDTISFVTPVLDVIQYFASLPSITPQRSDKSYDFSEFGTWNGLGTFYLVIPAYGRKYASFVFKNGTDMGGPAMNATLFGVRLSEWIIDGGSDYDDTGNAQLDLVQFVGIASGDQKSFNYVASANPDMDYFVIGYARTAPGIVSFDGFTTSIVVSDVAL